MTKTSPKIKDIAESLSQATEPKAVRQYMTATTATTIDIEYTSNSSSNTLISDSGGGKMTYVILEELPNHIEVKEW